MQKLPNDNPAAQIGGLLRGFRESMRLTQSSVAKKSGISSSMLSQIESSLVSPSVTTLFAICEAMRLDMAQLMKSLTQTNPVQVFHPLERPKEESSNATFETLISRADTPHAAYMFLMEVKPMQEIGLSGQGKDLVAMGYVITGSVMLIVEGKQELLLKKGDSILFKSLCTHAFKNTTNATFKAVWSLAESHRFITSS